MRPPRFRLRTLMLAVAAVAVLIAAESMRRRSVAYRALADRHAEEAEVARLMADSTDDRIAYNKSLPEEMRTAREQSETAKEAELARGLRRISDYHASLGRKYEHAASHPWLPVAPDPPPPE